MLLLFTVILLACRPPLPASEPAASAPNSVTIMTFNVENLFDNADDPLKDDKTFLALTDKQSDEHKAACAEIEVKRWRDQCLYWDWSDEIVDKKLRAVAGAILQVDGGRGPDIVALQEIENIEILERLRQEYLADAAYLPAVLVEGNDLRGIDVAFLSRLELAGEPVLHAIPFTGFDERRIGDTRGILQADFVLSNGAVLTGYSVHFPSPYHPTEMREVAFAHLNKLKRELPDGRPVFAAGDFNIPAREDRENDMLARHARPGWIVAHELGCGDCKGTQYYPPRDEWSFLDMLLWSPGETRGAQATWAIRENSVYIANDTPDQVRQNGTPERFELPGGTGVSDHWPLVMTLEEK